MIARHPNAGKYPQNVDRARKYAFGGLMISTTKQYGRIRNHAKGIDVRGTQVKETVASFAVRLDGPPCPSTGLAGTRGTGRAR